MTIMCAWCKTIIEKDETFEGEIISHSICAPCAKKLKAGEFEDVDFPQPDFDPRPKTH